MPDRRPSSRRSRVRLDGAVGNGSLVGGSCGRRTSRLGERRLPIAARLPGEQFGPLDEQRNGERSGDDADEAETGQSAGADDDARENVPMTGRREPISTAREPFAAESAGLKPLDATTE